MKYYDSLQVFLKEILFSGGPGDFDFDIPYMNFRRSIQRGRISPQNVKEIVETAMQDPQFDWLSLALETNDFIPADFILRPNPGLEITGEDVFNYFKMLTWDILYPELYFTPVRQEEIRRAFYFLLQESLTNDEGWLSVEQLVQQLRSLKAEWSVLEYYNIQLLYEPYRGAGLIEVKWKCLVQVSHLRLNPDPKTDEYLSDLIRDGINPFCLLPHLH